MNLGEVFIGLFSKPRRVWKYIRRHDDFSWSMLYYGILVIFGLLFTAMIAQPLTLFKSSQELNYIQILGDQFGLDNLSVILSVYVFAVLFFFLVSFLRAIFMQVFLRVFGGEGSYGDTLVTILYGSTTYIPFIMIPFVNFVGWVYSVLLTLHGLMYMHKTPTWKTFGALLLADVVSFTLGFVIVAASVSTVVFAVVF